MMECGVVTSFLVGVDFLGGQADDLFEGFLKLGSGGFFGDY